MNPSVYIQKTLIDINDGLNIKLKHSEAFHRLTRSLLGDLYYYHIVSEAYLKIDEISGGNVFLTMSDDIGNKVNNVRISGGYYTGLSKMQHSDIYNLNENGDFNSEKLYKVFYTLVTEPFGSWGNRQRIAEIVIDRIEGLMTYREYVNLRDEERQRTTQEQNAQRRIENESSFSGRFYGQRTSYEFRGNNFSGYYNTIRILWGTFTVSDNKLNIHVTGGVDGNTSEFVTWIIIDANTIADEDGTLYRRR